MGFDQGTPSQFDEINQKLDFIIHWIETQESASKSTTKDKKAKLTGLQLLAIDCLVDTTKMSEIAETLQIRRQDLYEKPEFHRFRKMREKLRKGEHL